MNIYVGNLSYSTEEDDLRTLFGEFGEVKSVNIIMDRETGRSKGFAFVEMDNEDEGTKAIDALNEKDFNDRKLNVNVARPRTERPDRPRRGGGSKGQGHGGGGYGGGNRSW